MCTGRDQVFFGDADASFYGYVGFDHREAQPGGGLCNVSQASREFFNLAQGEGSVVIVPVGGE